MIQVYVYITGLALLSQSGASLTALLPSGRLHPPEIDHVATHETHASVLRYRIDNNLDRFDIKAKVASGLVLDSGGDAPSTIPDTVPSLSKILKTTAAVRTDCKAGSEGADPCQLSGEVTLAGTWLGKATYQCLPADGGPLGKLPTTLDDPSRAPLSNYVNALKAWERRFDATKYLQAFTNGVVFSAPMELKSLETPLGLTADELAKAVYPRGEQGCATQDGCVFIEIRNGVFDLKDAYVITLLGAGDPHFSVYYPLLSSPNPVAKLWLPVAVGPELCGVASAAGSPGLGCSPARK